MGPPPDDWDDDWPDDNTSDEAVELVPCPECGQEVYEEAEQCPYCGNYITHSTNPWIGRPLWWLLLGLVGIAAAIIGLVLQL